MAKPCPQLQFPKKELSWGFREISGALWVILERKGRDTPIYSFPTCDAFTYNVLIEGFPRQLPRWLKGKESACQCRRRRRHQFNPWVRKIPWRRKWQPTPVFLPGKFHGGRSLADYSPWGCKESDTTESTHHSHLVLKSML